MIKSLAKALVPAVAAIGFAAAANAVTIIPVSAIGSSAFPGYPDSDAIDTDTGSALTDWASFGEGSASTLSLDLGALYVLTSASVTDRVTSGGGNGGFVGGTTDFTTSYSLTAYTDATFTTVFGAPVIVNTGTPVAPTGTADFLTTPGLTGLTTRYIRYSVLAANGANPGLSNISFEGTLAGTGVTVPEPATWAMLIVGFSLVGVAARRRKAAVAA